MIFRKKDKMIDIGEMVKQGKITPIRGNGAIKTDSSGFVNVGGSSSGSSVPPSTMNFFDSPPVENTNLVERITALSKTISKVEQRLEVIEKKLGVGDSSPSAMW